MKESNNTAPSGQTTTYDHVLKYTWLFGGVQGINMLVGVVRNKIVALLLGPEGTGLINLFNNITKLINEITSFGISFSAVKHIAELRDEETPSDEQKQLLQHYINVVRTWSVTTGLLGLFITLLLAPFISRATFGSEQYTADIAILCPLSLCLTITGGELAILKGIRRLKEIAIASVLGAIAALLICTPIYYYWRMSGIPASLVLCSTATTLITCHFSNKAASWRSFNISKQLYADGIPMIKLGIGFICAGVMGEGTAYITRAFIIRLGDLADVGLYNSGYMMAVTYASVVFIAIEADYFPRLSAAKSDVRSQNFTVNQQIEVCTLLIAPCLVVFVTLMPFIVPLLFSSQFINAVPMSIAASFYMLFRAFSLPTAYLSLAHGDSFVYMLTEFVYDLLVAICTPLAFYYWGLQGCGFALSFAGLIYLIVIQTLYHRIYGFTLDRQLLPLCLLQLFLLTVTVCISLQADGPIRWGINAIAVVVSVFCSLRMIQRKTTLARQLLKKFRRR